MGKPPSCATVKKPVVTEEPAVAEEPAAAADGTEEAQEEAGGGSNDELPKKKRKVRLDSTDAVAHKDAQHFISCDMFLSMSQGPESTNLFRSEQALLKMREVAKDGFVYSDWLLALFPFLSARNTNQVRLLKKCATGQPNTFTGDHMMTVYKEAKRLFQNQWNVLWLKCLGPDGEIASGKQIDSVIDSFLDELWLLKIAPATGGDARVVGCSGCGRGRGIWCVAWRGVALVTGDAKPLHRREQMRSSIASNAPCERWGRTVHGRVCVCLDKH